MADMIRTLKKNGANLPLILRRNDQTAVISARNTRKLLID